MRMLIKPRVRQGIKIGLALLSIPLIAWMLEFAYTHYLSPRFRRTTTPHMILSNHGYEGYDYGTLNSLLRKMRRIEQLQHKNDPAFMSQQTYSSIHSLLNALESEQSTFNSYYYNTLDSYERAGIPLKLRRRLHYYRTIIRQAVNRVSQLRTDSGPPHNLAP